ncbi:hypothetical protein EXN66_Car009012 [Channa argus]|uniref:Uncharacterized protein n=1 Tax=Channa argus TaxID=215402 RepID=A0A6G1PTL8_CHAAH|nr:hypothetical protein EXN66_Car009012 [Channa argus]
MKHRDTEDCQRSGICLHPHKTNVTRIKLHNLFKKMCLTSVFEEKVEMNNFYIRRSLTRADLAFCS